MLNKKECVAMLLAGGQGSRLYALTSKIAKPAVRYGAKYRIIDFPLSNCINSNIDTVGVLTQYQPLVLNEYIGNGQPWDLDRTFGGVRILPPYQGKHRTDWYKGTANAIYQNIDFMKRYNPEYILVLSGDHIYKMDYSKMINFHKQNNAEVTIAVIDVSLEEASRFGIMNTDENLRINDFEEKPKKPKSTKASMGIYVFNAELLYKYLEEDEKNPESQNDFGKNIIPEMLKNDVRMYAYPFKGYWKDVGTIDSLLDANMDLLNDESLDIFNKNWKIYSRNDPYPPQFICKDAIVKRSLITVGCYIKVTVINSLLSNNVKVEKGAIIKDSVIFENTVIKEGAIINHSIVANDVVVGKNAIIGEDKENSSKIAVVGEGFNVLNNQRIEAGEIVEVGSKE